MADDKKATTEETSILRELVTQLIARQPQDPANMGLPEGKRRELTETPKPTKYRLVACKSEETGATFDAAVVESRDTLKHPHGRIVRLENYRHPEGIYVYQNAGGLVPDGMPMLKDLDGPPALDANGQTAQPLSVTYKHWRWEEYLRRDLRSLVGKGLRADHCADGGQGLKTPWQSSPFFGSDEASAA